MDVVELTLPAAVVVPKILTVEGFGREGVSIGKGEVQVPIAKDPIFGRNPVTRCSTSNTDTTCRVTASQQNSVSRNRKADVGLCMFDSSFPSFVDETTTPQITFKDAKPLFTGKQLQRKAGKTPKSSSLCSKRSRSEQVEGSIRQPATGDCNFISGKDGSSLTECTFAERSRVFGQKHNLDGKRGDKRKTKIDLYFSKGSLMNSSSSAGGGSILGIYGLKSDIHDVTKHVDELSLNDLLDGSYEYPTLCQNKGKKAANANENLVHTIKKACSILQPWRPVQSQIAAQLDSSSNRKLDTGIPSSGSSVTSARSCTKGDSHIADFTSSSKDTCTTSNASLLYQPKDILEHLALPPAKNLDALLLDSSKPAFSRSTTDLRLSKPVSYGASLPPFPWSQCSSGPSKIIIDTGRFSNNRNRWVRIGSIFSSVGEARSCFLDLDSLTFDNTNSTKGSNAMSSHKSLEFTLPQRCLDSFDGQLKFGPPMANLFRVPEADGELTCLENDVVLMGPPNHLRFPEKEDNYTEVQKSKRRKNGDSVSSSHCSLYRCPIDGRDQYQWHLHTSEKLLQAGYSPRLLAAAQTLYEISRHSAAQNHNSGKLRWPKKPSQKAMKARKPRSSTEKTEDLSVIPKLVKGPSDPDKITDKTIPSKKLKYSTNSKKKDISHTVNMGRGPMKWSIPTSSRSPPSRSENIEAKQSNSDSVKVSGMTPSSKRVLDKACDSELRKPVLIDWGRVRSKNEF